MTNEEKEKRQVSVSMVGPYARIRIAFAVIGIFIAFAVISFRIFWLSRRGNSDSLIMACKTEKRAQTLKRPANPMPDYVAQALQTEGLKSLFDKRPWYQRNDYLGWILGAKSEDTRVKRLQQMLDELRAGNRYMKMAWRPKR